MYPTVFRIRFINGYKIIIVFVLTQSTLIKIFAYKLLTVTNQPIVNTYII